MFSSVLGSHCVLEQIYYTLKIFECTCFNLALSTVQSFIFDSQIFFALNKMKMHSWGFRFSRGFCPLPMNFEFQSKRKEKLETDLKITVLLLMYMERKNWITNSVRNYQSSDVWCSSLMVWKIQRWWWIRK